MSSEGDKRQPNSSTSLWVITKDFRVSLSVGNELCVMYKHCKAVSGFISSHIYIENKKKNINVAVP